MIDAAKQAQYGREGSEEDWAVARLVDRGRLRHGLFFAHLAVEKLLKALICSRTKDLAPRIHNFVRLAELANAQPNPQHLDALADLNACNLEGRYPGSPGAAFTQDQARAMMARAQDVLEWLNRLP